MSPTTASLYIAGMLSTHYGTPVHMSSSCRAGIHYYCCCVAGVPVSADIVLRTSFLSIATWLNSKHASSASEVSEGPQDMDTDTTSEPVPLSNGAEASEQSTAQDEIIKKVMQELVFHSRAEVMVCHDLSLLRSGGPGLQK